MRRLGAVQRYQSEHIAHFTDLLDHREATMRTSAAWLKTDVPNQAWPSLSTAASFDSMRARSSATVPDRLGVLKDPGTFFRVGAAGEGIRACSNDQLCRYRDRLSELATPEVATWLDQP